MNPSMMKKAMKQMGIKQEDIDADEVIIKGSEKNIVIKNAQVTKINMQGHETFQITGDITEESNEEDIKVFYELVGFCLLKEYTFEKAFMFLGNGRNGKGKSLELIKRLVGVENTVNVPLSSLEGNSFNISELFGNLVNLAGDIDNKDLKSTSMFKSLTGRDLITAHRKFLNDIHFENHAKFVFACNELPMVYDFSRGFWDRWILLNFPYTFVVQKELDSNVGNNLLKLKNPNIINEITGDGELSGLLNMALVGLQRLLDCNDFSFSKGCDEVKKLWISKSNSFMGFCFEELEYSEECFVSKRVLRRRYSNFCRSRKLVNKSDYVIKRVLQEMFGCVDENKKLEGEGYESVWFGVKWKDSMGVLDGY